MADKKDLAQKRIKIEQELAALKREQQMQEWLERTCKTCGEPCEERGGTKGYFTEVEVTVAPGEEGFSNIKSYLCEECLVDFTDAMQKLNFVIHAHGGICYLEAEDCPAYQKSSSACPTPEKQYED